MAAALLLRGFCAIKLILYISTLVSTVIWQAEGLYDVFWLGASSQTYEGTQAESERELRHVFAVADSG